MDFISVSAKMLIIGFPNLKFTCLF